MGGGRGLKGSSALIWGPQWGAAPWPREPHKADALGSVLGGHAMVLPRPSVWMGPQKLSLETDPTRVPWVLKVDTQAVPVPALRKGCGFQTGAKDFAGAPVHGAG